jgi:hypothetical protein
MSQTEDNKTFFRNTGGPHRLSVVRPVFRRGAWTQDVRVRRGDICDPGANTVRAFPDKWVRVPNEEVPHMESDIDLTPYHRGSGWYEVNGQKVKGRDAALAAIMGGGTADGENDSGCGAGDPVD